MSRDGYRRLDGVKTPWGKVAELRARRLSPGPKPAGREAIRRHQSERLFGAAVALVSSRGYANTSLRDLAKVSGVTEVNFYKCFDSKDQCFLALVDELYGEGMRVVEAGYSSERDWERRVRAALGALVALILEQPAAAGACIVNVYEAGEPGSERVEAALVRFEGLLAEGVSRSERRSGLPTEILAALVGGLHMVIHDRLRCRRESELPGESAELLAWLLSYTSPPEPLRQPDRQVEPAGPPAADAKAPERLLAATAAAVAARGYRAVTVTELAREASTSLRELYAAFGGKEEVFLATFDQASEAALMATSAPYQAAMPDWPRALAAAIEALLTHFAARPDLARLVFVEALGAGANVLEHRDEAVKPFVALLEPGLEESERLGRAAGEAVAFGAYRLVQRHLVRHGPASLPRLGPTMTFLALAPFLGAEEATGIANKMVPAAGDDGLAEVSASHTSPD